jgi:hypothetical protein
MRLIAHELPAQANVEHGGSLGRGTIRAEVVAAPAATVRLAMRGAARVSVKRSGPATTVRSPRSWSLVGRHLPSRGRELLSR